MKGIVLRRDDAVIRKEAKQHGLQVTIADEPTVPYKQTLIVGAGVDVPWDLVDAGFHFVERWDCAAPLWRYGVLAADVGSEGERERTRALTLDLRIPLYAQELLFLRWGDGTDALLAAWQSESVESTEPRLAFLRALCRAKPMFLALPRSWLLERPAVQVKEPRPHATPKRPKAGMVHVEIAPGRYVCCRPDEAEKYKQRFAALAAGRRGR